MRRVWNRLLTWAIGPRCKGCGSRFTTVLAGGLCFKCWGEEGERICQAELKRTGSQAAAFRAWLDWRDGRGRIKHGVEGGLPPRVVCAFCGRGFDWTGQGPVPAEYTCLECRRLDRMRQAPC